MTPAGRGPAQALLSCRSRRCLSGEHLSLPRMTRPSHHAVNSVNYSAGHNETVLRFQSRLAVSLEAIKEALDNQREGFDNENVHKPGSSHQRPHQRLFFFPLPQVFEYSFFPLNINTSCDSVVSCSLTPLNRCLIHALNPLEVLLDPGNRTLPPTVQCPLTSHVQNYMVVLTLNCVLDRGYE